jgi:hypothetical protein
LDDCRVPESGEQTRLAGNTGLDVPIGGSSQGKNLHHDRNVHGLMVGEVNGARASNADQSIQHEAAAEITLYGLLIHVLDVPQFLIQS